MKLTLTAITILLVLASLSCREKEQEQKEQEQKEKEKKEQRPEQEEEKEFPRGPKPDTMERPEGEMTEQEADMMLRGQEEEEAGMRADMRKKRAAGRPRVLKNW